MQGLGEIRFPSCRLPAPRNVYGRIGDRDEENLERGFLNLFHLSKSPQETLDSSPLLLSDELGVSPIDKNMVILERTGEREGEGRSLKFGICSLGFEIDPFGKEPTISPIGRNMLK